ncbi:unnamed protein product, partial [marine sediment metagenome]
GSALLAGELDGIIDDIFMAVILSKERETVSNLISTGLK